ncbi:MAG: SpoIID/LytB domain-containing protein [Candidatus Zixiibacteriota bacterium]
MKLKFLVLQALALLMISGCARMNYALRQEGYDKLKQPIIRVRVVHTNDQVQVGAKGDCVVRTWDVNSEKSAYYSAVHVVVKPAGQYLSLFDLKGNLLESKLKRVTVVAELKSWLWLDKRKFRGIFEFYPDGHDTMYVVNVLHVEDYLRGVLAPEIGRRKEEEVEAVKAQAVAARTYALVTRNKYPGKEYDLVNEILDQVYTGVEGEQRLTDLALKQTRGEVMKSAGRLIDAYYHSTCGGHTDNIEDVWEKEPRSYLVSVEDDTFCNWSKYYTWDEEFPAVTLLANVRSYLKSTGRTSSRLGKTLNDIAIESRSPGGRIAALKLVTEAGSTALGKDIIRWAFARPGLPGILRSSDFAVELKRNANGSVATALLHGRGYGHGVGMCQCGAIGRARAGIDYKSILTHYYKGVEIQKLY